ncbi:competence/damage-inducible protein A [bacterium]|nr:competence/damage-inducible protein A [bacterium]
MNAEIITIGDEILIGQTIDTNSAWIAQELNALGIDIVQISSVRDRKDTIHAAIKDAETRAELILMTGGLGPTKDDITKYSLAEYFNTELVRNELALKNIEQRFAKRGITMLQINKDQALVPANCEVILNAKGTAPGMLFEENNKIYVSMPGVPYEMKNMMLNHVIPKLSTSLDKNRIIHKTITVVNVPESILSNSIEDIENQLPEHIKLAYLPHLNLVRLRLSGRSTQHSSDELLHQIETEFNKIKKRIGDVWFDGDQSLSEIVGYLLKSQSATVGTVESCSGGFIAHTLTKIPGSSAYYSGSLLTYSNELKMEKLGVLESDLMTVGAVSEEVAHQMAKSGKQQLHVDYCLSTTGIAGPTGATDEKDVGLVYIGLAKPDGTVEVRKNQFHGSREQVIERTANSALNWLRECLSNRAMSQSAQILEQRE